MRLITRGLPVVAWLLLIGPTVQAADQSEAVAAIKKLGGKVEVDEAAAGKPVVKVDFQKAPVSDADLEHLKGLNKLQELRLSGTKITDHGLGYLKGLTELRKLTLDRTEVTDDGLKLLQPLTNLHSLNLCETPVTDAGLKHLAGFTKLEYLDLAVRGCNISEAAVKELQKALPKVKIDR
jgi:hypothetical protein